VNHLHKFEQLCIAARNEAQAKGALLILLHHGDKLEVVSAIETGTQAALPRLLRKLAGQFEVCMGTGFRPDEPRKEEWIDTYLVNSELFAWLGEDELGSGAIGLKQAVVPAGCVPLVACMKAKMVLPDIIEQLQFQAKTYGKTIRLVRFVFEGVEMTLSPKA
jgi:hypothetical protein